MNGYPAAAIDERSDHDGHTYSRSGSVRRLSSDGAAIGSSIPLEDLDRRGLARPIRTQESKDLTAVDTQIQPAQHCSAAIGLPHPRHAHDAHGVIIHEQAHRRINQSVGSGINVSNTRGASRRLGSGRTRPGTDGEPTRARNRLRLERRNAESRTRFMSSLHSAGRRSPSRDVHHSMMHERCHSDPATGSTVSAVSAERLSQVRTEGPSRSAVAAEPAIGDSREGRLRYRSSTGHNQAPSLSVSSPGVRGGSRQVGLVQDLTYVSGAVN